MTVNKERQKVGKHNALSGNTTLGARAQYDARRFDHACDGGLRALERGGVGDAVGA